MPQRKIARTIACLALASHPASLLAEDIVLAAPDYWCPVSCKAGGAEEGFAVELLRTVFERQGYTVRYRNLNYSRALAEARSNRVTAITAAYKREAPGFVFPAEPSLVGHYCFFTRPGGSWRYTGTASIPGRVVGVIQSYSYGQALDGYIQRHHANFDIHTGDGALQRMIGKLQIGRLDAFVEDETLVRYMQIKDPRLALRQAGCTEAVYAYPAFSPSNTHAQQYAALYSAGVAALRKSGELGRILARYGATEWNEAKPGK
ncbi:transporter substrate-binding domain-containing protein [Chitinivorax sp. PXF-14]|uniref:substrate-binding periplasmic protein n=1 Tax=Chitinivorax sp. PXF-14 TaxID=3230488 RepID=UPI003466A980